MEHLQTKSVAQVLGLSLWHQNIKTALRYHGTGGADTSKWEWASGSVEFSGVCTIPWVPWVPVFVGWTEATNIHRDTMASHVGHYTRLALGNPVSLTLFNLAAFYAWSSTQKFPIYLSILYVCAGRDRGRH